MTAVDAECPHGSGDPAWCSVCLHGPTVRSRRVRRSIQPPFKARHELTCPQCLGAVLVGALIRRCTSNEYVHAGCVEGPS